MKKCLVVLCFLIIGQSAFAQDIPEKRKFDHPKFSTDWLGHEFALNVDYDKFTDTTTVQVTIRLQGNSNLLIPPSLSLLAYFVYQGKEVSIPDRVLITFLSNSKGWSHLHTKRVIFLINGERLDIGPLYRSRSLGRGSVTESLSKYIPLNTFLRIITSANVDGQLGASNFQLSHPQLEALRDFASHMHF